MPQRRVGLHLLTEDDEPAFVALLREVYGDTYSHRDLYAPGGVARLVRSGRAKLWGDFDPDGRLAGHTAIFYKDPRGDYVESGLSFKRPRARPVTPDAEVWRRILADVAATHPLVHQSTTTWHPLAQRYAERYMGARATGLVVGYARGETLAGVGSADATMDAITMTSRVAPLGPPRGAPRYVPAGPWGEWLGAVLAAFDRPAEPVAAARGGGLAVEPIERVEGLDLVRRVVVDGAETLAPAAARTDLVHLPTDRRAAAFDQLLAMDYLPVGVRLHATRPDEIVLQRLDPAARREALDHLRAASLAGSAAPLVAAWRTRCAQAT